jgi:hypothetical protein
VQSGISGGSFSPIAFTANGGSSEQMRLTSSGLEVKQSQLIGYSSYAGIGTNGLAVAGNVGIGTSSPSAKLEVNVPGTTGTSSALRLSRGIGYGTTDFKQYYTSGTDYGLTIGNTVSDYLTLNLASGNLGLGVTPSAWAAAFKALQINAQACLSATSTGTFLGANWYFDGSNRYIGSGSAALYQQIGGEHSWYTAPSGTAGNAISFTQALTLDVNRNLLLNGTTAGASSVGTFTVFNGTAPTGSVTDGVILFAQDISSSSELRVRDEAGNVTTLSPHNFELIPEGPSEEMAWSYYSERDGKRINVDMLKAIRLLEKLSGEQLVYES